MRGKIDKKVVFGRQSVKLSGTPDEVEKATRILMELYGKGTSLKDALEKIRSAAIRLKIEQN